MNLHRWPNALNLKGRAVDDHLDLHVMDHDRVAVVATETLRLGVDQATDEAHGAVTLIEGFGLVATLVNRDWSAHASRVIRRPRRR